MNVAVIEDLKKELNHLIDAGADVSEIYEMSVRIDRLIVQYYVEMGFNRLKN